MAQSIAKFTERELEDKIADRLVTLSKGTISDRFAEGEAREIIRWVRDTPRSSLGFGNGFTR